MQRKIKVWLRRIKKEVESYPPIYFILFFVLAAGFFIRVYRVDQILGFYFDQGRDAQVIWNFWHSHKFFLIGPTTGIEGVFRGPWYYWLIAPFYLFGKGNPTWPAVFLAFTTIVANILVFVLVSKIADRETGLFASVIASFSYYLLLSARWLSNPTPMLLISMLLVLGMFLVVKGKKWAWLLIGFMLGMAMQFGSAAEIFYFPAVFIFAFWQTRQMNGQGKKLPGRKILVLSVGLVVLAFIPQIIFNFIHDGVLTGALKRFLFDDKSFKLSFWEIVKIRIPFYEDMFMAKLLPNELWTRRIFEFFAFASLLFNFKTFWKSQYFRILLVLLISPLVGMLFFQGNYGNVYDYYFTGYYLIFVLFFSVLIFNFLPGKARYVLPLIFLFFFLKQNVTLDRNYIVAGVDGPTTIAFGNQKQAIDWIYKDAKGKQFSVDVYVPPVIPYAYDYLFKWYGGVVHGYDPSDARINPLYTLYESDPPHPERLDAWLARQKGIGKVETQAKFGGITVQRRTRL